MHWNDVWVTIITGLVSQVPGDLLVFALGSWLGAAYERRRQRSGSCVHALRCGASTTSAPVAEPATARRPVMATSVPVSRPRDSAGSLN